MAGGDRGAVMAEITGGGSALKMRLRPTKTNDRSAPIIMSEGERLKKIVRSEITAAPPPPPPPVNTTNAPPAPPPPPPVTRRRSSNNAAVQKLASKATKRPDTDALLRQIREGKSLRRVQTRDASKPIIDTSAVQPVSNGLERRPSTSGSRPQNDIANQLQQSQLFRKASNSFGENTSNDSSSQPVHGTLFNGASESQQNHAPSVTMHSRDLQQASLTQSRFERPTPERVNGYHAVDNSPYSRSQQEQQNVTYSRFETPSDQVDKVNGYHGAEFSPFSRPQPTQSLEARVNSYFAAKPPIPVVDRSETPKSIHNRQRSINEQPNEPVRNGSIPDAPPMMTNYNSQAPAPVTNNNSVRRSIEALQTAPSSSKPEPARGAVVRKLSIPMSEQDENESNPPEPTVQEQVAAEIRRGSVKNNPFIRRDSSGSLDAGSQRKGSRSPLPPRKFEEPQRQIDSPFIRRDSMDSLDSPMPRRGSRSPQPVRKFEQPQQQFNENSKTVRGVTASPLPFRKFEEPQQNVEEIPKTVQEPQKQVVSTPQKPVVIPNVFEEASKASENPVRSPAERLDALINSSQTRPGARKGPPAFMSRSAAPQSQQSFVNRSLMVESVRSPVAVVPNQLWSDEPIRGHKPEGSLPSSIGSDSGDTSSSGSTSGYLQSPRMLREIRFPEPNPDQEINKQRVVVEKRTPEMTSVKLVSQVLSPEDRCRPYREPIQTNGDHADSVSSEDGQKSWMSESFSSEQLPPYLTTSQPVYNSVPPEQISPVVLPNVGKLVVNFEQTTDVYSPTRPELYSRNRSEVGWSEKFQQKPRQSPFQMNRSPTPYTRGSEGSNVVSSITVNVQHNGSSHDCSSESLRENQASPRSHSISYQNPNSGQKFDATWLKTKGHTESSGFTQHLETVNQRGMDKLNEVNGANGVNGSNGVPNGVGADYSRLENVPLDTLRQDFKFKIDINSNEPLEIERR